MQHDWIMANVIFRLLSDTCMWLVTPYSLYYALEYYNIYAQLYFSTKLIDVWLQIIVHKGTSKAPHRRMNFRIGTLANKMHYEV